MGEGLPPFPQNIATKIISGRFVEMYKMLRGHWAITRGTKLVTEFSTWVQCFALYTSVLGGRFPGLIPGMAYMATIARVSQHFAWEVVTNQPFSLCSVLLERQWRHRDVTFA